MSFLQLFPLPSACRRSFSGGAKGELEKISVHPLGIEAKTEIFVQNCITPQLELIIFFLRFSLICLKFLIISTL